MSIQAVRALPECAADSWQITSFKQSLSNTDGLRSTTAVTVLCEFARREELPLPWGFILTSVFMITSCELLFGVGRRMHLMFMHQQQSANMEGGFQRPRARFGEWR